MVIAQYPGKIRPGKQRNWPVGEGTYRVLEQAAKPGQSVYVTNLLGSPTNRGTKEPLKREVQRYQLALLDEIAIVRPHRILAMGDTVARLLAPGFDGLKDGHGTFYWNSDFNCWVVPTWPMVKAFGYPPNRRSTIRDIERFFTLGDPKYSQFQLLPTPASLPPIPHGALITFDIETTGLGWIESIIAIGLSWDAITYILPHPSPSDLVFLGELLESARVTLLGHNTVFDLTHLVRITKGQWPTKLHYMDTMQLAYLSGEEQLGLKHLTVYYTDMPGNQSGGSFEDPQYLSEDVHSTTQLYNRFHPATQTFASHILARLIPVTSKMRVFGMWANQEELAAVNEHYVPSYDRILEQLKEEADINWNSKDQVVEVLLERGFELKEKTKTGKYSIKEDVLQRLIEYHDNDPLLVTLAEYVGLRQINNLFLKPYKEFLAEGQGYFRPRLFLTGARTGRFSMKDPNLQQVPRVGPLKRIFTSRWEGGKFAMVDLSGAELRVAALLANDENMAEAILSGDPHRRMASRLYRQKPEDIDAYHRKRSKAITFGLMYGGSSYGLAQRLGISTEQVDDILRIFETEFPGLMSYLKYAKNFLVPQGYVKSPFGKIRYLHDLVELGGPNNGYRKAANTPIQGTASECMGYILAVTWDRCEDRGLNSRPICLVHDSMEADIYPGEEHQFAEIVQEAFYQLGQVSPLQNYDLFNNPLPLVGELIIGNSWAEVESTNEFYAPDTNLTYPCTTMA